MLRECKRCHRVLDISEFPIEHKVIRWTCKDCRAELKREYRQRTGINIKPYSVENTNDIRRCPKCGEYLSVENFTQIGFKKNGDPQYRGYCDRCYKRYLDLYRHRMKDDKRWYEEMENEENDI